MKEYNIQKAFVKYINLQYPNLLFSATMGGQYQKHYSQRIKQKLSGYSKGMPDVLIFEPIKYNGLFIELKTKTGRPTIYQKKWIEELNKRNYYACVCKGFEECVETLDNYMNNKL